MHKKPLAPSNCPKTLIKDIDELTKILPPGPVQEWKRNVPCKHTRHYLECPGDDNIEVLHAGSRFRGLEQDGSLQEINQLLVTEERAALYREETEKDTDRNIFFQPR